MQETIKCSECKKTLNIVGFVGQIDVDYTYVRPCECQGSKILEVIIDKIIPEYKDVPFQYKVLLFKERTDKKYFVTREYGFNEDEIDQLVNILIKPNSKINFIKALREIKTMGLKGAKYLAEEKIRHFEFENELLVNDAKRIIMERF